MKGGKSKSEASKKADTKLSVKRKATEKASRKLVKSAKAAKDPSKPKRPSSAFFIFMEEFRKEFKEKNPDNKSVSVVGKAAGDKWKSMSALENAPYEAKAAMRLAEYNKAMVAYNKKQIDGGGSKKLEEEESDKSKSEEQNDDDDDESGEDEVDDEDDE